MHDQRNNSWEDLGSIDEVDADEKKLCEVIKHPVGIALFFFQAGVGMIVAIVLIYALLPSVMGGSSQALAIANIFAGFAIILSILGGILAATVYRQNRLIVTDRNITQILQYGLFNRKVSQLNLVNVEDVTSVQNGFLPTMFGYGTVKIETAGEQENFSFSFCPRPNYYAKVILEAREIILGQHDGDPTIDRAMFDKTR